MKRFYEFLNNIEENKEKIVIINDLKGRHIFFKELEMEEGYYSIPKSAVLDLTTYRNY